jgi:two-component system, NarL family, nitrate/nitrite response regulator NarL
LRRRSGSDHALDTGVEALGGEERDSRQMRRLTLSLTSPETPPRAAGGVVLAGGQALVRAVRRSILERAGLDIVAEVSDVSRAVKAAELYAPGVVLIDFDISGGCVPTVRRIKERTPGAAVLVIAPELDQERLLAAIRAGADGFIPETLGASGLVRAIEVALTGDAVIPRAGVTTLIDQLRGVQEQTEVDGLPLQLTRREADVVARFREGMTPKEIAYELELSDVTVRRHLSSVARKARQARPLTLALESTS